MLLEEKTLDNIMTEMKNTVKSDISVREGSLIDHALRGAAAEFEQAYIELWMTDRNGYAQTADREHLILRAKERGITPFPASNAVWKATFNINVSLGTRFSAGKLTYSCIAREEGTYRLQCEQAGIKGNKKQEEIFPIEFLEGFETGELIELLTPGRDEEDTETFRLRYLSLVSAAQAFGGNRAQYRQAMYEIAGVGACKIYRVRENIRRIKIYFLNSLYQVPDNSLVSEVQKIIDPIENQGDGEGSAPIFHIVDIFPCAQQTVNVEAEITIDTGYAWKELLPEIQLKIDEYFLELAKSWEKEVYLTIRILKINAAIASVEGIVDVQGTLLNSKSENLMLEENTIPVRGTVICRKEL